LRYSISSGKNSAMQLEEKSNDLDLDRAVETGLFLLPELPGELSPLPISGLQGRVTPISSPFANVVGAAQLDAQSADSAIDAVIEYFMEKNLSFGWRVGPSSTPRDLGTRLLAAGMKRLDNVNGLRCDDLSIESPSVPEIIIREAVTGDLYLLVNFLENAYHPHSIWGSILGKAYLEQRYHSENRTSVYLAFADGSEKPAAFGSMYRLPDQPVFFLSGAATRETYRRRGIYSKLVTHRLNQAHKLGAVAAVIQGAPESSKACFKLGFTKFCEFEHYIMEHP